MSSATKNRNRKKKKKQRQEKRRFVHSSHEHQRELICTLFLLFLLLYCTYTKFITSLQSKLLQVLVKKILLVFEDNGNAGLSI
jgi:hypothetical protein